MYDARSNVAGPAPVGGRPRLASGELPRYFSHVPHSPPCSESSLAAATLCLASVVFPSPASSRTLCLFPWLGCSFILHSLRPLAVRDVLAIHSPPRTQDFQPPSVTLWLYSSSPPPYPAHSMDFMSHRNVSRTTYVDPLHRLRSQADTSFSDKNVCLRPRHLPLFHYHLLEKVVVQRSIPYTGVFDFVVPTRPAVNAFSSRGLPPKSRRERGDIELPRCVEVITEGGFAWQENVEPLLPARRALSSSSTKCWASVSLSILLFSSSSSLLPRATLSPYISTFMCSPTIFYAYPHIYPHPQPPFT